MPLDRAVLDADLELIRGLLHQVVRRESHDGVVEAVSALSKLLADRAGAEVSEVQSQLLDLLTAEGLLPCRTTPARQPLGGDGGDLLGARLFPTGE